MWFRKKRKRTIDDIQEQISPLKEQVEHVINEKVTPVVAETIDKTVQAAHNFVEEMADKTESVLHDAKEKMGIQTKSKGKHVCFSKVMTAGAFVLIGYILGKISRW